MTSRKSTFDPRGKTGLASRTPPGAVCLELVPVRLPALPQQAGDILLPADDDLPCHA